MSEVQYKAEQKFGPLTSNGDFWRSKCPECGNKDKSLSIHKESGYYHCWHESCETVGYVDGEQNIRLEYGDTPKNLAYTRRRYKYL